MVKHAWTTLCTKCIIDPETNNISLVDVIEQLNPIGPLDLPVIVPMQSDLVSTWYRSDPDMPVRGTARVSFVDPSGSSTALIEYLVDLTTFYRTRSRSRSGGFQVTRSGVYYFRVELRQEGESDWTIVEELPLNIEIVNSPPAQLNIPTV